MPTCFVVQGFGKKTDFESGRMLDLDASYDVIKEAVEAAGLECVRADEILQAGNIERVMYEQLLYADLVVADLSTSNVNAFYELGVRFGLRPSATIVVAESKLNFPFDVNHIPIRTYEHLGTDIGRKEAKRFIAELKGLIEAIMAKDDADSPVFTFLTALAPPVLPGRDPEVVVAADGEPPPGRPLSDIKQRAKKAMDESRFSDAIPLWSQVREEGPKDDFAVQQLALATYKSEEPSPIEALHKAADVLEYLWPRNSLDPETLGLWAAVQKRIYQREGDEEALEQAIVATEKGWVLCSAYYNGANLAFLLDLRAARRDGDLAEEDRSRARGVRRRVVEICRALLEAGGLGSEEHYWVLATLEEAAVGMRDDQAAASWHAEAAEAATAGWMLETTADQIAQLRQILG